MYVEKIQNVYKNVYNLVQKFSKTNFITTKSITLDQHIRKCRFTYGNVWPNRFQ